MLTAERPILTKEKVSNLHSRFTPEPLEPGFGHTLGNPLRRTLLSSAPDAVMTSTRIDDIPHEFHAIEGTKEDVAEITLNIKQIVLSSENDEPVVMYLRKAGSGEVLVGDITPSTGVEIYNPDLHFATLNEKGKLEVELIVEHDHGYVSVIQNKDPQAEISRILIDLIYPPVVKTTYKVEATRAQQCIDFDRLAVDVETKPAITPRDAPVSAGRTLVELFDLMRELNEEAEGIEVGPSITDTTLTTGLAPSIENLNLQSRSYNALRHHGTPAVGEPVAHSETDLLDIRDFGTKSIKEVEESLAVPGMTPKDSAVPSLGNSRFVAILSDDQST